MDEPKEEIQTEENKVTLFQRPMLRIRDNATIREINLPSDKLEVLQKITQSNVSEMIKVKMIRELCGSFCCLCKGIPSHEIIYDVSDEKQGATRIERYCDKCVKTVYEKERALSK